MENENTQTNIIAEEWLSCITWSGQGDDLPSGLWGMPGIFAYKLVYRVIVNDAESEAGIREIKVSEYDRNRDDIIDVIINNNSYKSVLRNYTRGFTFLSATGGRYSREGWRTKFGSDALKLMAIRELMQGMNKGLNKPFKIGG